MSNSDNKTELLPDTDAGNPRKWIFGDWIESGWASDDNPRKYGRFVKIDNRKGRVNPGLRITLTDGHGAFWSAPASGNHRLRRIKSRHPDPALVEALEEINAALDAFWNDKSLRCIAMHQDFPKRHIRAIEAAQKKCGSTLAQIKGDG